MVLSLPIISHGCYQRLQISNKLNNSEKIKIESLNFWILLLNSLNFFELNILLRMNVMEFLSGIEPNDG